MVERSDTNGEAPRDPDADEREFASFWDAAVGAGTGAAEIASHVATLLAVRADRARAVARSAIARVCVGLLVLAGVGTALVAASWRIVAGTCDAAAALLANRPGLGDLAGGAAVLIVLSAAGYGAWKVHERAHFKMRKAEYAERRRKHSRRFGEAEDETSAH